MKSQNKSVQISGQIPSTSIRIGDIVIHQSANGLYSVQDLWVAGGKRKSKQSSDFLKLKGTQELVDELLAEKVGTEQKQQVIEVIQGGTPELQGTFVCKELAYAYAIWISPKFALLVIRTFDAVISAIAHQSLEDKCNWLSNQLTVVNTRRPDHPQSLSSIMGVSPSDCHHYYQHLVSIGELEAKRIPQPDRTVYQRTPKSKTVTGQHGNTPLFDNSVKSLFPQQTLWMGA